MNWFGRLVIVCGVLLLFWTLASALLIASWIGLLPKYELVSQIVLVGTVALCGVGVYRMLTVLKTIVRSRSDS